MTDYEMIEMMRQRANTYMERCGKEAGVSECHVAAYALYHAIGMIHLAESALAGVCSGNPAAAPERLVPRPKPIPEYWNYDAQREAKVEVEGLA